MFRMFLMVLTCLSLSLPLQAANDPVAILEKASLRKQGLQPGLNSYQVHVQTSKINEMIERMTASMPPDVPRPATPVIVKYWLRGAPRSLIVAEKQQAAPFVAQMVERFSSELAVELDNLLLPAAKATERQELADRAKITVTEVTIADTPLQQVQLDFEDPVDLDQAFYTTGIHLPQKQVTKLAFDIDAGTNTVNELNIATADGLQLTVELRYKEVGGGHLPQRIQVTSPDGKVDDLTEITFTEAAGFQLPERMVRTLRRPDRQDDFQVEFIDYRVNQPLPEVIRNQLHAEE